MRSDETASQPVKPVMEIQGDLYDYRLCCYNQTCAASNALVAKTKLLNKQKQASIQQECPQVQPSIRFCSTR